MRLFVFARHGQSTLNVERRVNGDPAVPVALTAAGREAAAALGAMLAPLRLDLAVHTPFTRTRETLELALAGRAAPVPTVEEPLLGDIDVGELEGDSVDAYRAWKHEHARSDPFPGGESLDDAARRYARAFRRLLDRDEERILVICHEIPLRYALNASSGTSDLDGPTHDVQNATPYLFDEESLARAAACIESLVGGTRAEGAE